jgi:hypothetical protein
MECREMLKAESKDPLAKINGLQPRYVRERLAAKRLSEAALAAAAANRPPAPEVHDLLNSMRPVDAATPDLRRRILAASQGRMSLGNSIPAFASVSFMTGFLLNH